MFAVSHIFISLRRVLINSLAVYYKMIERRFLWRVAVTILMGLVQMSCFPLHLSLKSYIVLSGHLQPGLVDFKGGFKLSIAMRRIVVAVV